MSHVPTDLYYTKTHEWISLGDDNEITVGVTEHAQQLLGDIVFVELPELDTEIAQGDDAGVIESVKAAADVYAPITGVITAVNRSLLENPELINQDPFGDGWLFRIKPDDVADVHELLDADAYLAEIEE